MSKSRVWTGTGTASKTKPSKDYGGFLSGGLVMSWSQSTPNTGLAGTAYSSLQGAKTRADMRQTKRKSSDFCPEAARNTLIKQGHFREGSLEKLPKLTTGVRFPSPAPNKINDLAADLERK